MDYENKSFFGIGYNIFYFIFIIDQVCVEARKAVHVGDDQKADKEGANAIGIDCWYDNKQVDFVLTLSLFSFTI